MNDNLIPAFAIKRIKEFSFLVNETLFETNKFVRIQFQHNTKFGVGKDENLIDLTLRVYYAYDDKIPPENFLVDFHVQNVFEVHNLSQYKNETGEYILPQNFISSILGIAISHMRALMAHNVAGTSYQENIIPIVNPVDVARAFYPNMFKGFDTAAFEEKMKKSPKKNIKSKK